MSRSKLTVTKDLTADFNRIVREFKREAAFVGVPDDAPARFELKQGRVVASDVTNAQLFAIHNFGSPVNNIPARPVMDIAVRASQTQVAEWYRQAVIAAFTKGPQVITPYYEKVGRLLARAMKKVINQQDGIEPPADSTLSARRAQGFMGTKALLVTKQMRDSITSFVGAK